MIESNTFKKLDFLNSKFKGNNINYELISLYFFRKIFSKNKEIEYNSLLEQLEGMSPIDLFKYIPNEYSKQISFSACEKSSYLMQNEFLPPPHLANFEWRYSSNSSVKIVDFLPINKSICCLGTPTLGIELANKKNNKTLLLDINKPLISIINENYKSCGLTSIVYNVLDDLNEAYCSKFDIVLINPPWYLDYYITFIIRSIQLLKKEGGLIILPLFPILSRNSAFYDLISLREFLKQIDNISCESLGYVDFEMPNFEKKVYEYNNIPTPNILWRKAELIKLEIPPNTDCAKLSIPKIKDYIEWEREYIKERDKYFVLNKQSVFDNEDTELYYKASLNEFSRKNINFNDIVLWDEDNKIIVKKQV